MTKPQPKHWYDGQLKPCSLAQFIGSLRRYADYADREFRTRSDPAAHLGERLGAAADEIERLHAEVERMRAALEQIADGTWNAKRTGKLWTYHKFARAALEGK